MGNSLHKFHIRPVNLIAAAGVILVVFILLIPNIFFLTVKNAFEETVGGSIDKKVSIGSVYYYFPNIVIARNIFVFDRGPKGLEELLHVKKVSLVFSLGKLIKEKKFIISKIYLQDATPDYERSRDFLYSNLDRIKAFLLGLPEADSFSLSIKNVSLAVQEPLNYMQRLLLDFDLTIRKKSFNLKSSFCFASQNGLKKGQKSVQSRFYLDSRISGNLLEDGLALDNLELKTGSTYAKMWGSLRAGALSLNGFFTLKDFFKYKDSSQKEKRLSEFANKFISLFRKPDFIPELSPLDLNIYDFRCKAEFENKSIRLENLGFSLKNIPFTVSGDIDFSQSLRLNAVLESLVSVREGKNRPYVCLVKGIFEPEGFDGSLVFKFIDSQQDLFNIEAKGVSLQLTTAGRINLKIKDSSFIHRGYEDLYIVVFSGSNLLFDSSDERFLLLEFSSGIYDGLMTGKAYLEMGRTPLNYFFTAKFGGIDCVNLVSLDEYLSKVKGKIFGRLFCRSLPGFKASGTVDIRDGSLDDFDFFCWLADFFKISSLKKVEFDNLKADFLLEQGTSQLSNLKLAAADLALRGDFSIMDNGLVSSLISIGLSSRTLEESPRFKALTRLLGEGFSSLDFDFQLSGPFQKMNFKWLDSYFKKRLQDTIPDFIERGIERQIDLIAESKP
ncbi:MAG: hypothetical protein PHU64_03730 [Candidatus Omnitrophica bacterium]|nr:hypothetical protein [Candidatus Omnitrophota bacterium]MDD5429637.1 hypothetical protein [Candidatus Omnitrophota bacterium]